MWPSSSMRLTGAPPANRSGSRAQAQVQGGQGAVVAAPGQDSLELDLEEGLVVVEHLDGDAVPVP